MYRPACSFFVRASITAGLLAAVVLTASAIAPDDTSIERAVLVPGLGTYHRPIATDAQLAQQFFNQGLRLVYGYYFPEAIASFQQAQRHDATQPMIAWGLALAMAPNPNSRKNGFTDDPQGEGRKAIALARTFAARATPIERAFIDSLSVLYDSDRYPDRASRDDKYIEATRAVLERYPDDLEAGFLYADALMIRGAWKYWRHDGSPLPGTLEAAQALEHVMALAPDHPGAVHLYVHLFESSKEPDRALPQADRLESLMPKAGHMVHMPSHIYIRVGQYDKAVESNQRSIEADRFFLTTWGDHPFPAIGTYHLSARVHATHAWDVLRYAAALGGRYTLALEAARTTAAAASHTMNPRQQRAPATWAVQKMFGRWEALLSEPAPPADRAFVTGVWHYARGSAFVGRGELDAARGELNAIAGTLRGPGMEGVLSGANTATLLLQMLSRGLAGEIAMAGGKLADAVREFEEAVRLQDTLTFDEPPDWGQSMRLYLGDALLKAGRAADAEAVYRDDLREYRDNGWALFGLWQSLREQKKNDDAEVVRKRFDQIWQHADVTLHASVF